MLKSLFTMLAAVTLLCAGIPASTALADSGFDNWKPGFGSSSGSSASRSSGSSRGARAKSSGSSYQASSGSSSGSSWSGGGSNVTASYYWQPQRVASGGWFNPNAMTAAHKTLPFGTRVRVSHPGTGRSVEVTINDRGPYIAGREIDLSLAAASSIGMTKQGVAGVRMEVLGR